MKKKRWMSLSFKRNLVGYLFVLPVILGLTIMFVPALVESMVYSFSEVTMDRLQGGITTVFTGLANYNHVMNINVEFKTIMIPILIQMGTQVPVVIIFSFLMANILNQRFKGRLLARALYFLPVIVSAGVVAFLDSSDMLLRHYGAVTMEVVNTEYAAGLLNVGALIMFYRSFGFGLTFIDYAVQAIDMLYIVLTSSGVQIVIFLAALQTVPQALYEASYVEGCSGWESFWKITLPIVSPIMLVCTVYTVVDAFLDPRSALTELIRSTMFARGHFGLASSMTWLYFGAAGAILAFICFLISRLVFYYDA